jgi:16S rRNA processing protein RimM
MTDRLILVGRVAGAFGVKGEVRITTFTADPLGLAAYGPLFRKDGSAGLTLTSARAAKGGVIARTPEITTPEEADRLRGLELFVPREALPDPDDEDEFYLTDLVGLTAVDPAGATLGKVLSVENYGAGDLIEVKPTGGGQTWLIEFTRENAPTVSISEGRIVLVRPTETEATPEADEA